MFHGDVIFSNFFGQSARESGEECLRARVGGEHRGGDRASKRPDVQDEAAFTIYIKVSCAPQQVKGEAYRWTIPGSTAYVTRNVALTLIETISVISSIGVSTRYPGMLCDFPTLFT